MATKRKRPKRRPQVPVKQPPPPGSAPADFAALLDRAFTRNGDNPILLNIQQGLDSLVDEVRHIGQEQGKLAVEQARTAANVEHIADEQANATGSRREMHRKLDEVGQSFVSLKTVVDRIAPMVDAHQTERSEKAGQRKLITKGRVVIAGLMTGSVAVWHQFENIRAVLHGKPIPHP